jgi:hypothetical protein
MKDGERVYIDGCLLHDLRCFLSTVSTLHVSNIEHRELKQQAADIHHRLEVRMKQKANQ